MQVYKYNESGIFIEPIVINDNELLPLNITDIRPNDNLYRAKWTGGEWIEDMSQTEIDALNVVPTPQMTDTERIIGLETVIVGLMDIVMFPPM